MNLPANPASSMDAYIDIQNAVLSYPMGPYVKRSLKSQILSPFTKEKHAGVRKSYVALNGLNLSIKAGERVGVIGRNGAGKSTLLRAIADIYPLESGRIEVKGRIQSLFDFALGFEGDSTGRENITYRGLAMGFDPKDIAGRVDEIIAFADIGEFIDIPMRTYSAGMFVRLAFAISTYLEGDILLIDEIFGAGDATFRAKALKRMESIVERAKIVVFVSHELETIKRLCSRVVWIDGGVAREDGPSEKVIATYLEHVKAKAAAAA